MSTSLNIQLTSMPNISLIFWMVNMPNNNAAFSSETPNP